MADYTPPVISNGDALAASSVSTGFSDYGDAINFAVGLDGGGPANIPAGSLSFRPFHKNCLTELWTFSNDGVTASCPVRYAAANGADTTAIQAGRNFAMLNKFEIEGCCGRIYLQRNADLYITASADFKYCKTATWGGGAIFTHTVSTYVLFDSEATIAARSHIVTETGADTHRRPLHINHQATRTAATGATAGWHDIHMTADFRSSSESTNAVNGFIHWVCTGRSLNVLALYR